MSEDVWDDGSPMPEPPVPISRGKQIRARKAKAASPELTEIDLSERLIARAGADLRYCADLGGWFAWTGTHWTLDKREVSREAVKDVARDLMHEAAEVGDVELFKAAKRAASAAGIGAILDTARSTPGTVFLAEEANRNPWLLNCTNGTLELKSGEVWPHDRADVITRVAGTKHDPEAEAPMFTRFLEEVQPDPEVRAYLARLLGYAAIGVVHEHVLGVFWGSGKNGKSVLAEVVMAAFGEYARPGPTSLIVSNRNSEPHPTDVASCVGSRLVVVHETKRGAAFDASKVKLLTGGDKLTTRYMREDFFDFAPSHTLIMLSNYKPEADGADAALWRRVQLVPFMTVIPEERRDRYLAKKIIDAELPGVLRWLIDGCLDWQRQGLAPPSAVTEQTEAYRLSEDTVTTFLDEACKRLPGVTIGASKLYQSYSAWVTKSGSRPLRSNDFATEIQARGIVRLPRSASGYSYSGIALLSEKDDSDWRE